MSVEVEKLYLVWRDRDDYSVVDALVDAFSSYDPAPYQEGIATLGLDAVTADEWTEMLDARSGWARTPEEAAEHTSSHAGRHVLRVTRHDVQRALAALFAPKDTALPVVLVSAPRVLATLEDVEAEQLPADQAADATPGVITARVQLAGSPSHGRVTVWPEAGRFALYLGGASSWGDANLDRAEWLEDDAWQQYTILSTHLKP